MKKEMVVFLRDPSRNLHTLESLREAGTVRRERAGAFGSTDVFLAPAFGGLEGARTFLMAMDPLFAFEWGTFETALQYVLTLPGWVLEEYPQARQRRTAC